MSKTINLLLKRRQEILLELAEVDSAIAACNKDKLTVPTESIVRNSGYDTSGDFNPMSSIGYGRGDDERGGPNDR